MPNNQERRRHPRFKVTWQASLRCIFDDVQETVQVRLGDISAGGVMMYLDVMEVGPHHLADFDSQGKLELNVQVPGGVFKGIIEIRWYVPGEGEARYKVGTEFVAMTRDNLNLLQRTLKQLAARR